MNYDNLEYKKYKLIFLNQMLDNFLKKIYELEKEIKEIEKNSETEYDEEVHEFKGFQKYNIEDW